MIIWAVPVVRRSLLLFRLSADPNQTVMGEQGTDCSIDSVELGQQLLRQVELHGLSQEVHPPVFGVFPLTMNFSDPFEDTFTVSKNIKRLSRKRHFKYVYFYFLHIKHCDN